MSDGAQITHRTLSADTRYYVVDNGGASMTLTVGTFNNGIQLMGEPEDLIRLSVAIREGVRKHLDRRECARVGGMQLQEDRKS